MVLVLYITVSWLVITYYITGTEKHEVIKGIIICMILVIVEVNIIFSISLNMELIKLTEDKIKFLALCLYVCAITPFLIIIFIDKFNTADTHLKKAVLTILLIALTAILEAINIELRLYTYAKWSYLFSILLNSFYILISLVLNKGLGTLEKRGAMYK
ncbi:hypothetical protein N4T77_01380 [Clostridium sp. CX1]|uniref:Uncharacterized protein n=1 Tax=Clostridium tanneri TaxID=3037988 RepID=A0ABU4JVE4_9CLOT|nr:MULTISPECIES: hypothetical protein [unclassified Clostridium]MCT8975241.1 hypothetical protein [Clostridium sp. CX1]MDW8802121.1 hypothetical protein [Clostridium sp. A1-XYC3]